MLLELRSEMNLYGYFCPMWGVIPWVGIFIGIIHMYIDSD
jgi:hypothetical protein